ncbi:MAG: hypothetical protein IT289_09580 [Oligoflexia bacterium]|nr:hypothetical protein [Oligoflexia bacterium]
MKRLRVVLPVILATLVSPNAFAQSFEDDVQTSTPQAQQPRRRPTQQPVRQNPTTQQAAGSQAIRSQAHFQPWAGRHVVTAKFLYEMSSTNVGTESVSGTLQYYEMKHSDMAGEVTYEYGITPNYSAGLTLNYGMGEDTITYDPTYVTLGAEVNGAKKSSGLGELVIFGKGLHPMKSWSLIYGLNFAWSGDKEVGSIATGHTTTGNRSFGGMAIEPYAGGQFKLGKKHTVGAKLGYRNNMNRKIKGQSGQSSSDITTDFSVTGGNRITFTAFYETYFGKMYLDPYLGYSMISEETGTGTITAASNAGLVGSNIASAKASRGVIFFGADLITYQSKTFHWGGGYRMSMYPVTAYSEGLVGSPTRYQIQSFSEHQINLFGRFVF